MRGKGQRLIREGDKSSAMLHHLLCILSAALSVLFLPSPAKTSLAALFLHVDVTHEEGFQQFRTRDSSFE